jgi:hypothetical protein
VSQKPWGRTCRATTSGGKPCKGPAIRGADVCRMHGGSAPQVREAAARRLAAEKARRAVKRLDAQPTEDPIAELQRIAGETVQLKDWLRGLVDQLTEIRYRAETEQTRAELSCYMAALRDCTSVLTSLARLNLDERSVRIKESQAQMVRTAVDRALREAGLEGEQLERGRQAVGRHLRVVHATKSA